MIPGKLHAPTAVAAALCTAALVNVAQFPSLEIEMSDWYEATRVKPDHDLLALAENHFGSTQGRYVVYLQLGELAPGAVVELPPATDMPREHFNAFAEVAAVEERAEATPIDAAVAAQLEAAVVATGEDRHIDAYAIALPAGGEVERIVVVAGPDRTWLVEEGLLAAAREAAS